MCGYEDGEDSHSVSPGAGPKSSATPGNVRAYPLLSGAMEQTQPLNVTSDVRPSSSLRAAVGVFLGLVGLGLVLRATDPQRLPQVETFVTVFASLLVEALSFVLLGRLCQR
jgi:hypothetical protein